MIQSTSVFPHYIFKSKDFCVQTELKIFVCTQQQMSLDSDLLQKHKGLFKSSGIAIRYMQNFRQVYLSARKCLSFKIQQSCEVTFSQGVQGLQDFYGVATDLLLSAYLFSRKTTQNPQIRILIHNSQQLMQPILHLVKAKNFSRQIANGRGDVQGTPQFFVKQVQRIKDTYNLTATIFKGEELLKQRFRLLHAVGRASHNQPAFANITYNGNKNSDKFIAFVGKGVCFDAGGLDIKSHQDMKIMFLDKQGASSVLAAFQQVVKQKLLVNLTCSIGLVQNLIGSKSYRPSDIIKSRKGYTVRIQDTDAQGRLVLADAMHWTQQNYKTQILIELSTLTYSNIAALGQKYAGIFSNSDHLSQQLFRLGKNTHEHVWRMPIDIQHHQKLQIKDADILSDTLDPWAPGGSIAAAFLQKFVQKGTQWAHLDIAGVGILNQVGTGWGTMLLIQYLRLISNKNQ